MREDIVRTEEKISQLSAARNCDMVRNYAKDLGTLEGNFGQLGMLKLKNQLIPKDMAKKDKNWQ